MLKLSPTTRDDELHEAYEAEYDREHGVEVVNDVPPPGAFEFHYEFD